MPKRSHFPALAALAAMLTGLTVAAGAHHPRPAAFLEQSPEEIRCHNEDAVLVINRNPFRLALADTHETVQFAQPEAPAFKIGGEWVPVVAVESATSREGGGARLGLVLANGAKAGADVRAFGPSGFNLIVRVPGSEVQGVRGVTVLTPVEEVYGFGEMWNGRVAQRGQAFDLWDKSGTPDECAYMPYYVSTNNYAFFLNYGGLVRFDVGQRRSDRLTFVAPAKELDITLVRGDSIPSTVRNFFTIQGLPKRPPRWAFKPWFWLMSDPKQPGGKIDTVKGEHHIEIVEKLNELQIPVGVTWFEPPWQDARNSFIPNPEFSPDFQGLVKRLEDMGVKSLAWSVPYTTNKASNWDEAVAKGYMVKKPGAEGESGAVTITGSGELRGSYYNFIDYFNPEAFRWWREQIEKSLDTGIRGYKPDAGQDLPSDAILHGGRLGADVHNSYALEFNRVFYEALSNRYGDDFLMVPRAAWVGSGAYTNFKWPGDLSGSFANNGLPSSVYSSLSLAFCGIPFLSTDIGGFDDQPAPELPWLRWAQFGAMMPGMQTLHMPWWYSKESVVHFRYLAWLHTDLTPYWMSLAHEASATAAAVCRPLVWEFQDDIDSWRVHDEFTVGPWLLVAPMINADHSRETYLPPGLWYDFWDNAETRRGPVRFEWFKGWFVRDKFPLYIREGAIIPMEVANEFSGFGWAESAGYVTLAMWPKVRGSSEFVLHDTEGPVRIAAEWGGDDVLRVSWDATRQKHLLRIHIGTTQVPAGVAAGGQPLAGFASLEAFRTGGEGWYFDASTAKLWVRKLNSGQADTVSVRLGGSN